MIFDSTNLFSDKQAVTESAASTNVIDLGVTGRDLGVGEKVNLWAGVDVDFAGLTSLQLSIEVDDDEGFGTAETVVSTGVIALADLTAGYQFALQALPKHIDKRYMRLAYTVVGTGNAGTITAGLTMGNQSND